MSYKIEKSVAEQMKGLGIIFVIFGHLSLINYTNVISIQLKLTGIWGVTIFLSLSGYGLMQSYLDKGISSNFFPRRLKRVLLPYAIVSIIWIVTDALIYKRYYPFTKIVKALFALDIKYTLDPTMWYITYIFMWYIVFYIIFVLPIKDIFKVILLLIFTFLLKKSSIAIIFDWKYYYMAFPLGVVISYFLSMQNSVFKKLNNKIVLSLACIIAFRLFLHYILKVETHTQFNKLGFSSIMLAISLGLILTISGFKSKILSFLGSISYELYLFEGKFICTYGLPNLSNNRYVSIIDYCIIIILLSIILVKVEKFINKDINLRNVKFGKQILRN